MTAGIGAVVTVIDDFYRTSPVEAAALTCGIKASCSDAISQRGIETDHDFCYSRNFAFILYGSLYQGCAQHFIFNELYPAVFGTGTDLVTVVEKVLVDQLLITPLLCLPIAYLVKAAVFDRPLRTGLEHYVEDAKNEGLLWKYWGIWTPAQCLTFSVVPEHLRIPFIAAISFFWLIILSNISSRPEASAPGKTVICYDNECLIMDEIDDPVDFPQYFGGGASSSPSRTASSSSSVVASESAAGSGLAGSSSSSVNAMAVSDVNLEGATADKDEVGV